MGVRHHESSVRGRAALGKISVLWETCFGRTWLDILMNPFVAHFRSTLGCFCLQYSRNWGLSSGPVKHYILRLTERNCGWKLLKSVQQWYLHWLSIRPARYKVRYALKSLDWTKMWPTGKNRHDIEMHNSRIWRDEGFRNKVLLSLRLPNTVAWQTTGRSWLRGVEY